METMCVTSEKGGVRQSEMEARNSGFINNFIPEPCGVRCLETGREYPRKNVSVQRAVFPGTIIYCITAPDGTKGIQIEEDCDVD